MPELDDLKKELAAATERLTNIEAGMRARTDAERWSEDTPDFYKCRANANAMAEEIQQRGLPFTYESYAAVYADIKDKLEKESAAEPQEQPAEKKPGKLTNEERAWLQEVDRLSANEYQKRLAREPGFAAKFERLSQKTR